MVNYASLKKQLADTSTLPHDDRMAGIEHILRSLLEALEHQPVTEPMPPWDASRKNMTEVKAPTNNKAADQAR